MQSFEQLSTAFSERFSKPHFPATPSSLYDPNHYFLQLGGKRVRPVLCLMGNELFDDIHPSAWEAAVAIELFHNFTLIHDDIMDKAPLRRGMQTVHVKHGENTALLAGDVMMIKAYDYLNKVEPRFLHAILSLFNKTAIEVCEGQQLDMDFETQEQVSVEAYLDMIEKKTSVLLAASLKMGAIVGGAGERNQDLLFEFGRKLGLAFQVQDDYLDAFGDPQKFGKQVGGDILANKKTFLLIHAMETATVEDRDALRQLIESSAPNKVERTLEIYRRCKVDQWALELKSKFLNESLKHLEEIAVLNSRKSALRDLALYLVQREV
jgi:geranylgeranyl diphosphate synthase type II